MKLDPKPAPPPVTPPKIEVKQDFRNANPDNVWLQMLDGVNSAAESRLSSALIPDFTR